MGETGMDPDMRLPMQLHCTCSILSVLAGTAAGSVSSICCEGCCVQPEIPANVEGCTYEDSTVAVGGVFEDGCRIW